AVAGGLADRRPPQPLRRRRGPAPPEPGLAGRSPRLGRPHRSCEPGGAVPTVTPPPTATDLLASARQALLVDGRDLRLAELGELAALADEHVPALAALAHEVRVARVGTTVEVEGILSAKTGGCPEDCSFCSQSSRFDTPVQAVPFLAKGEV